jgi:hypothetical protein
LQATTGTFSSTGTFGDRVSAPCYVIADKRITNPAPNAYPDFAMSLQFNQALGDPSGDWVSAITMRGWNSGYATWQLASPSGTVGSNKLYLRSGASTTWQPWVELYHTGNIEQSAAALMAVQAAALAPQWVASLPGLPNGQYPKAIYNSSTGLYDGGMVCIISTKAMYQNINNAWVAVGVDRGIFGQVVAAQISVASIGASALVADLAMVTVIRSTAYTAGTYSAKPSGYKLSGPAFTTYYIDGTYDTNCHFECEGSANIGGLKAAVIANRVMGNTYFTTSTMYFTAPEGITTITLMLCAPGGRGADGTTNESGGGGQAGGYMQIKASVTPNAQYYISCDSDATRFYRVSDWACLYIVYKGADAASTSGGSGAGSTNLGGFPGFAPHPEKGYLCIGDSGGNGATIIASLIAGGFGGTSAHGSYGCGGNGGMGRNLGGPQLVGSAGQGGCGRISW